MLRFLVVEELVGRSWEVALVEEAKPDGESDLWTSIILAPDFVGTLLE